MNDRLTRNDIRKMEEEIEHRKLVIRKEAIEAVKEAREQVSYVNETMTMLQRSIKIRTKAVSVT